MSVAAIDIGTNSVRLLISGTPEKIADVEGSYTGQYLKKYLRTED